jgi:hypothetical protein
MLKLFQLDPRMGRILRYLSNMRSDLLDDLISNKMEVEKFYKIQGQIDIIDDILGLPKLLETSKLREV